MHATFISLHGKIFPSSRVLLESASQSSPPSSLPTWVLVRHCQCQSSSGSPSALPRLGMSMWPTKLHTNRGLMGHQALYNRWTEAQQVRVYPIHHLKPLMNGVACAEGFLGVCCSYLSICSSSSLLFFAGKCGNLICCLLFFFVFQSIFPVVKSIHLSHKLNGKRGPG